VKKVKQFSTWVVTTLVIGLMAGCPGKVDPPPPIPNVIPPLVSLVTPENMATGVPINMAIAATFSEAMDPLTLTTSTFTLEQGTTPVAGAVAFTGFTATFTPAADLAANTLFTATITTGAKNVAGAGLELSYVWNFTTGAAPDTTAPMVSYTVPVNAATGVAANSAMAATFSEAMDPATITTTTFTLMQAALPVAGAVTYAGLTATFTPTVALAYSTVYTATITTGAKDLAGNALAANKVWTFTTGSAPDITAPTVSSTVPVNNATGVSVNSAKAAIFSEAMNPTTITTATFTLRQGLTQIVGVVTYAGFTATFMPSAALAYNTVYTATITTGAKDLAGNALAADKIWTFTTGVAPDLIPPTVSSTIPANSATNVAVNSAMSATFSEAMNPTTITTATFTLLQGTTPVVGAVTYVGFTATFTPTAVLAYSTGYKATITTGAKDLAGNALALSYVWNFTTGIAPDTTAPTVLTVFPVDSATGVPINSAMTATFSEAMDPTTITNVTFSLTIGNIIQTSSLITGTVTYAGVTATFTPDSLLAYNTLYTGRITVGVEDLAHNPLAANKLWAFTTGAAPDTTAPTVLSTIPLSNATGVPINNAITATFSEAMDPATITNVTFTMVHLATPISGTVTYAGTVATFTPSSVLPASTLYSATITVGAKDLAGNPLASLYTWSFTTGVAPGLQPVSLGHAAHYAVLAGYAVTNVPASIILGDVGVSPSAESTITGFSQTRVGTYSTSNQVTGFIFAADHDSPTPINLGLAKGDLTIAINDAAGRTPVPVGAFLDPGTGNLAGLTLVPGLYKFTGSAIATTDFTLTGGVNDVWIFQIATNLNISNGVHVYVTGGAQARNIFWQVGTEATLGTTVIFHGTIMADAGITMNTGATLYGRALVFTGTAALDQNTVTLPQ